MIDLIWILLFVTLLVLGIAYLYCALLCERQLKANYLAIWSSFTEGASLLGYPLTISNRFVAFVT